MKNSKIIKKEEEKTLTIEGKQLKIKRKIIPFLKSQNEIKEDCFAYNKINKKLKDGTQNVVTKTCSALNDLYCKNTECRFYKSQQKYLEELELIKKRRMEEN